MDQAMLLLGAGVSITEFRAMSPALADALAERRVQQLEAEAKADGQALEVVVQAIGNVGKAIHALHKQMARRPTI